ncbi:MAG: nitrogen fixation/metabolism regulation signal transduction histidine kinase [Flammeovirgaceae bacterium]|jgi:two-component system nitrogen regulation sensor histidine kinase NtrY
MIFSDFKLNIIARVVGLALTIFILVYLIQQAGFVVTILLVGGLIVFQMISLINLLENTNKEVINFLSSIRYDDFSNAYKLSGKGGTFDELNKEFNSVLLKFKDIRAEKEADHQYLRNIIHHVGIGVMSFNKDGEVQIMNTAAKRLLKVNRLRNIQKLESFSPELVAQLSTLRTGTKALVRVRNNGELVQLAIYAIELYLKGEEFKLVTIQNIHSELEEKEMEAWQNLIRVLTHEIMNSITPISSLSGMLEDEVDYLQEQASGQAMENMDFDDIKTAVQTIKRRSEGLIRFVSDFQSLTHMPEPKLEHITVQEMFSQIKMLLSRDLEAENVVFSTHLSPESMVITADREQIEQVLINLIKNAKEALEEFDETGKQYKSISLIGNTDSNNRPVITVKDNGPGIEKTALDRIFIPFFTTKKKGSGIGLSLSRQILRQHKGTLIAKSEEGKGTEFSLKF